MGVVVQIVNSRLNLVDDAFMHGLLGLVQRGSVARASLSATEDGHEVP